MNATDLATAPAPRVWSRSSAAKSQCGRGWRQDGHATTAKEVGEAYHQACSAERGQPGAVVRR
jgi:hypothetical protein